MKESYDDEKMYSDDLELPVEIRNYREVLRSHDYSRYEKRFRALADRHQLSPAQRPKLDQSQFAAILKELRDAIAVSGEEDFLENEKHVKAARRLLIEDQFEEWV